MWDSHTVMLTGDLTCGGSETPIFLADFLNNIGDRGRLDWNWPEADLVLGICQKSTASSRHRNTTACVFISEAQDVITHIKSFKVQSFVEDCGLCVLTFFGDPHVSPWKDDTI